MDVKDTVNKAPLMIHLVELVVEKFPDASDLYSDLPSVHRIAKVRDKFYIAVLLSVLGG